MGKPQELLARVSRKLDIPGEILTTESLVELRGRSEVQIVRHNGIVEYTDVRIQIAAKHGRICISGAQLRIAMMNRERILVYGRINAVQYDGEETP